MKIELKFCLSVSLFVLIDGYRILGLFPLQGKSHHQMFDTLFQELAKKGHEVDVLSHFPQKKPLPGFTDINVSGSLPAIVNNVSVTFVRNRMYSFQNIIDFITSDLGANVCQEILNTTAAQDLKNSKKKYDLIVMEIFGSDCMLGFAHHLNVPVVGIISSVALPWVADRIGNPDNPSYIPNYFASYLPKMTLTERLLNTIGLIMAKLIYNFKSVAPSTTIARKFFGPDLPDLQKLVLNTSLILVNSHFSINMARPVVPNFIEVGGLHINPPKPLPKHLKDILESEENYKGVIYFSTGSMVLSETFPLNILQAFFDTFKEIPYKVLWKASRERMPAALVIPSNIHFEPWLPQVDILCHPNVKLFVSHGGLMGTQESIYCGVPRLGIPLFGDQSLNLKVSEAMGIAISIDYNDICKDKLLTAVKSLLEDTKYIDNAKRISKLFKDRPISSLDTAIYWIEYVIRHNGAPHLRSVGADLLWYQYLLLDVIAILLLVLIFILTIIYYVCKVTVAKSKALIKIKSE